MIFGVFRALLLQYWNLNNNNVKKNLVSGLGGGQLLHAGRASLGGFTATALPASSQAPQSTAPRQARQQLPAPDPPHPNSNDWWASIFSEICSPVE